MLLGVRGRAANWELSKQLECRAAVHALACIIAYNTENLQVFMLYLL